ncbi:uncharacterized protein EURHEDRAFT_77288 [Aspergillus ruber CBS 135680]|uniref:Uncharacterized protein n=1 Tax=Aspergillus ruber (strain CBS 135680) TaxID=1388766 RepID=A0A017SEF5_ASPRC|nr:uncharacterized protein EURHEDRAFT_77288 [Aspergillus ruber CBS 135680]EYE95009.1 hypothetical protein EURHEDRAFT_77288 [Aspergillus ruber CBS 135680]
MVQACTDIVCQSNKAVKHNASQSGIARVPLQTAKERRRRRPCLSTTAGGCCLSFSFFSLCFCCLFLCPCLSCSCAYSVYLHSSNLKHISSPRLRLRLASLQLRPKKSPELRLQRRHCEYFIIETEIVRVLVSCSLLIYQYSQCPRRFPLTPPKQPHPFPETTTTTTTITTFSPEL